MSVNSYVLNVLVRSVGGAVRRRERRDMSRFCGTWTEAECKEFEDATESTRRIDAEAWA